MTFLENQPAGLKERPEVLVCAECGIAYGVMKNSRPRTVTCWLVRKADISTLRGVTKISVDTIPTLE